MPQYKRIDFEQLQLLNLVVHQAETCRDTSLGLFSSCKRFVRKVVNFTFLTTSLQTKNRLVASGAKLSAFEYENKESRESNNDTKSLSPINF